MPHELSAHGMTVRYGAATALTDVDFTAGAGRVTAVVGPNGAGKSTLLLSLYGSVKATGRVELDGTDLSRRRTTERARQGIALVPQGRQLFPRLTVRENLQIMAEILHLGKDEVDRAIDRFPILRERSRSLTGVLSGGEQQMLVVSRALMGDPRVLLCDEMMTGLAPMIVSQLADTLAGLARDGGVAVVLAEPTLGAARRIIDGGIVLVRGSVVAEASDVGELDLAYRRAVGVDVGRPMTG